MKYSIFLLITASVFLLSCDNSSTSNTLEADPDTDPIETIVLSPCTDGIVQSRGTNYPCNGIDLVSHLRPVELLSGQSVGSTRINDIWGWTDPESGKEYALVGLTDGVTFVDISVPSEPVVLGKLPQPQSALKLAYTNDNSSNPNNPSCWFKGGSDLNSERSQAKSTGMASTWRDIKVFNNHAFIVSDAQLGHGMQVFDLTQLRDVSNPPLTFSETARYDDIDMAHNIAINEESGFAYLVGVRSGDICATAGLHIVDINNPANPVYSACYNEPEATNIGSGRGYIHDTQCVIYNGPDSDHIGKEICFSSSEEGFTITDVSDKENIQTILLEITGFNSYAHQGWLTDDQRFFLMNDELDEFNSSLPTRTFIFNVEDLDNPEFIGTYNFSTASVDHNLYIKDNKAYESNYTSGLRVIDLTNVASGNLEEVAFFDTYPLHNAAAFQGTWSNYPYFESGNIIVSDMQSGLFVLRLSED